MIGLVGGTPEPALKTSAEPFDGLGDSITAAVAVRRTKEGEIADYLALG